MKFHSVKMKNFRVFREAELILSTDPVKNVTLIRGNNGTGKTTLAQAFVWCLFGPLDKDKFTLRQDSYYAETAKQDTPVGGDFETEVSVKLENNGIIYTFSRTQLFMVNENPEDPSEKEVFSDPNDFKFTCVIHEPGKVSTTEDNPNFTKDILTQILPDRLAAFVFFNGEQINTVAKQIASSNSSEYIKEAVSVLLGTKAWDNAIRHLTGRGNVGNIGCVKRFFLKENARLADQNNGENLSEQVEDCYRHLEDIAQESEAIESEIGSIKDKLEEISESLRKNEGSAELETRRDNYISQIETNEELINNQNKNVKEIFCKDLFRFVADDLLGSFLRKLKADESLRIKDGIVVNAETIEHILKHHKCICGALIEDGSEAYNHLNEFLSTLPTEPVDQVINRLIENIEHQYQQAKCEGEVYEKLGLEVCKNDEASNRINEIQKEIASISKRLTDNTKYGDIVSSLEQQKRVLESRRSELDRRFGSLDTLKKEYDSKIKSLNGRLQNVAQSSSKIDFYNRCLQYTDAVINMIEEGRESLTQQIRTDLDSEVKQVFKSIGWDSITPSIDKNFAFSVSNQDGTSHELSEAQSLVSAISCIAGIMQLGKKIVNRDPNQKESVNNIPLIMDAPLSAFDTDRISMFSDKIPSIVDQLVIFIKDTDGDYAIEGMGSRIGVKKQLVNVNGSPFESEFVEWEE